MAAPQMTLREWAILVGLALIWSLSYLFQKIALTELPVVTTVLGRVGLAALALIPVVYLMGHRLPGGLRPWGVFLLLGALNNVIPFSLIVSGQQWVASGLTAILVGTTPLFAVVLAHFLTADERMTPARVAGVVAGIVGLVVLIGPAALAGLGQQVTGQVLIVAATLSYALAAIAGRRFLVGIKPIVSATGQLLCSTAMLLPVAFAVDQPWRLAPSWGVWGALAGIAIPCTAFAYLLYYRLLATAGATNLMLVTLLVPVGAVLWGALLAGEALTLEMAAGLALIAAGLAIIDGRLLDRLRGVKPAAR